MFFGAWDGYEELTDIRVLDSKGLPLTNSLADVRLNGIAARVYLDANGTAAVLGTKEYNNLVKIGKTWYVADGRKIESFAKRQAIEVKYYTASDSADQKTLQFYWRLKDTWMFLDEGVMAFVNPDGSVCANQTVYGEVNGRTQTWHTDRFGIPMDYYTCFFKYTCIIFNSNPIINIIHFKIFIFK